MAKQATATAAAPRKFKVTLPKGKRPGLRAVGEMRPGEVYELPAAECLRLVQFKGFELIDTDVATLEAAAATNPAEG